MPVRTELKLRLANSPGALAAVCRALADERINILGMAVEANGHVHLVLDNHGRGAATLRALHHQVVERDVIVVSAANAPGTLAAVLALASAGGVNIEYAYATAAEGSSSATVVLGVEDARRAATAAGL